MSMNLSIFLNEFLHFPHVTLDINVPPKIFFMRLFSSKYPAKKFLFNLENFFEIK